MLEHTFCHINGIGARSEAELWAKGALSWEDALAGRFEASRPFKDFLKRKIEESAQQLEAGNARFFSERLGSGFAWRMFNAFRRSTVYLDIETTGVSGEGEHITTIAMYDGERVHSYVHDENPLWVREFLAQFKVVVTYNGKSFDVPMIRKHLSLEMDHAHLDLRFILASLGLKGGLKGCERRLGISREELDGADGYTAVLLWEDFRRTGARKSLETLLAYNALDAANLETLMVMAYNMKLAETPFHDSHALPLPEKPCNPYSVHPGALKRVMDRRGRR
jgi:uncharacterized protein YprB with RNaseH-like and TPR domain